MQTGQDMGGGLVRIGRTALYYGRPPSLGTSAAAAIGNQWFKPGWDSSPGPYIYDIAVGYRDKWGGPAP